MLSKDLILKFENNTENPLVIVIDPSIKIFNVYLLYKTDNYMADRMEFRKLQLWKKVPPLWSN